MKYQKFKESIIKNFLSYLPIFPIIQKRIHLIYFRLFLLFFATMLLQLILLAMVNDDLIFKMIELSNPIEVLFKKNLNEDEIGIAYNKIKAIENITDADLLTPDMLREKISPEEPLLSEAEQTGVQGFQYVVTVRIKNLIGNPQNRFDVINAIKSVAGVNLVIYNQERLLKLDYLKKLANVLLMIFLSASAIFFAVAAFLSSIHTHNLTQMEVDYLNIVKSFQSDFSVKNYMLFEGVVIGMLLSVMSSLTLTLLWLLSRVILSFEFIFFPIWQVVVFIAVLTAFFMLMNSLVYRFYRHAV